MKKFFHRPAIALALVLCVIFIFILITTFKNVPEMTFPKEDIVQSYGKNAQQQIGPELPADQMNEKPAVNTEITLGLAKMT